MPIISNFPTRDVQGRKDVTGPYTTLTRKSKMITVHCSGLQAGKSYKLLMYTASRKSGNKMGAWYHPTNYDGDNGRIGYGNLAGYNSNSPYPPVPDWMQNGGYLQTEWQIDGGCVTINLCNWIMQMLKPYGGGATWDDIWDKGDSNRHGVYSASVLGVSHSAFAPLLFRFCVQDSEGTVYPCRNTLRVGAARILSDGVGYPRIGLDGNATDRHIIPSTLYCSII